MVIDHLIGTDREGDAGLVDPAMFAISVALCVGLAFALFAWVVPRAVARGPSRAASVGLLLSVLSVVPGIVVLWLGLPFVSAGAGVALGLEGWPAGRWRALAAIVLGAGVVVLDLALYAYALRDVI